MVTNLRAPYKPGPALFMKHVAGNKVRGQRIFETIGPGEGSICVGLEKARIKFKIDL